MTHRSVPLPLVRRPYTRVDEILENLDALDDAMTRNGDMRAAFLIAYRHITQEVLHALPSGLFEDREWVASFTLAFANRYREALVAWEDGERSAVPAEWQTAFAHATDERCTVLQHLLLGMTAHILYDLPMAVASTVGGRDSAGCLRDFLRVLALLHRTVDPMQNDLSERFGPGLSVLDYALLRFDEWGAYLLVKYYRRVAWDAAVGYLGSSVDDDATRAKIREAARRTAERVLWLSATPNRLAFFRFVESLDPSRLPYVGPLYPGVRRDTRVALHGHTLQLRFRRYLPQPPEQLFPLLTEPDLMNLWSEAEVRLVSPGDGGGAAAVGAVREVRVPIPGPAVLLDEVTERTEPPHHYVYRVTRCDQLGHHRGSMRLREGGRGTEVTWEVEIEAATRAEAVITRQILVPKLQASLDVLERIAGQAPVRPSPPTRPLDEHADLEALLRGIREQGRRTTAVLSRAQQSGHAICWPLRLVDAASDRIARAADDGHWTHPSWVLRCWIATTAPLLEQADVYLSGGRLEDPAWAACFGSLESKRRGRLLAPWRAVSAVLHEQLAHDYPAAIGSTWRAHYERRCDVTRFRTDELALSELVAELLFALARADHGVGGIALRLGQRLLAPETLRRGREQLLAGYARQRRAAFEAVAATLPRVPLVAGGPAAADVPPASPAP